MVLMKLQQKQVVLEIHQYNQLYQVLLKENLNSVIEQLYNTFKEQKILEIESNNLESKYDDFRLLYDEYHDGILMYQIQKDIK